MLTQLIGGLLWRQRDGVKSLIGCLYTSLIGVSQQQGYSCLVDHCHRDSLQSDAKILNCIVSAFIMCFNLEMNPRCSNHKDVDLCLGLVQYGCNFRARDLGFCDCFLGVKPNSTQQVSLLTVADSVFTHQLTCERGNTRIVSQTHNLGASRHHELKGIFTNLHFVGCTPCWLHTFLTKWPT